RAGNRILQELPPAFELIPVHPKQSVSTTLAHARLIEPPCQPLPQPSWVAYCRRDSHCRSDCLQVWVDRHTKSLARRSFAPDSGTDLRKSRDHHRQTAHSHPEGACPSRLSSSFQS